MRIGILTYHYVQNYGAVLQAYASCVFLKKLGHEVEIIDYHNPYVKAQYRSWFLHKRQLKSSPMSYIFSFVFKGISRMLRAKRFSEFSLPLSHGFSDALLDTYDIILIGSDQVWNTDITGGYDSYYFADFKSKAAKIAWAASLNKLELSGDFVRYMSNFSNISVREESLRSLLEKKSIKSELLCDPTLLLDKSDWLKLFEKDDKLANKNYILAYPMLDEDLVVKRAKQRAEELSCELIIIWKNAGRDMFTEGFQTLGVQDFLKYIYYAKEVFSSSFHGIALSLCLEKKFEIVLSKANTRIDSLQSAYEHRQEYRKKAAKMIEDICQK